MEKKKERGRRKKTPLSLSSLQMSSLFELIVMTIHMSLFNVIKRFFKETTRGKGERQKSKENNNKEKSGKKTNTE